MFSSNQTPVEDMKKAYELGAYHQSGRCHPWWNFWSAVAGVPENIFCRYNPGGTFQLGESEEGFQVMDKPGDAKYGMTREQMIDGLSEAPAAKGAKNFGIHAFLASNTISNDYYPALAAHPVPAGGPELQRSHRRAHRLYQPVRRRGHPVPPRPDRANDIMAIGEGVRKKSMKRSSSPQAWAMWPSLPRWAGSPPAPTAHLVATAIHEKHIYKEYIGLDACAANLMRPAMYGAYHHITVLGKEDAPCDHKYDVVGGLCENNDKFAVDRMLPKIDIGDIIYIHDTGAHGSAMGYNYNGKLRSAEVLLCEDGSHRLIRRAETPRDYFATLDFLPAMKSLFED